MVWVKAKEGESFGALLGRFKARVKANEILDDLRKHEFYRSPSEKRRWKAQMARTRRGREQRNAKNRS